MIRNGLTFGFIRFKKKQEPRRPVTGIKWFAPAFCTSATTVGTSAKSTSINVKTFDMSEMMTDMPAKTVDISEMTTYTSAKTADTCETTIDTAVMTARTAVMAVNTSVMTADTFAKNIDIAVMAVDTAVTTAVSAAMKTIFLPGPSIVFQLYMDVKQEPSIVKKCHPAVMQKDTAESSTAKTLGA